MGGDGGTLNNSRHEHTRLRASVLGTPAAAAQRLKRQRASVTHCALSKQPLRESHVVVDRLGQLYNKDALITYLLRRARQPPLVDAFAHITSLKRDTACVRFTCDAAATATFVCPVTRRVVSERGHFSVGWRCGCVTADVGAVEGAMRDEAAQTRDDMSRVCMACSGQGERVPLALSLEDRDSRLRAIRETRKQRRTLKRKNNRIVASADGPSSPPKRRKLLEGDLRPV
ncbi:unnamed protein product [Agarophyton chilense]